MEKAGIQKTMIVTGGSQGIGAGLVKRFLSRGYNVVASSRHITQSAAFDASDKLVLVDGNIGEAETAAKIAEAAKSTFGSIDALVNNAGIYFSKPFTDYTIEDLRALVSVTSRVSSSSASSRSGRCWLRRPAAASSISRRRWRAIRSPE